ncbi:ImmA/IrrE family metallo-endopeptidase [Bradyrhizobium centrosematis]|uniref:ImmA/IrrE family metallo-endopeptidase n=1 Tax=Bradyrhizobium centrosematis TaxID=1300039 RepID=UPI0021670ACD|nr:ImmA/IrrE family metallo-endopeptidase [Bradyrhizobium centrosematis]MCS3761590.1 hypothetical protein [Bradyrhizobium centrosematis]MCS3774258.1 hypothetical protein [Bradyrhizobium centrosematis]
MDDDSSKLFKELRKAGFSRAALKAAWPAWWSDELASSPSGRAELRFALARRLGLAPKPLLGERVEFIWKDSARFKHLSTQDATQQDILSSFGVSVGRLLLSATAGATANLADLSSDQIRNSILKSAEYVDLQHLIATCWALGVPVVQLRVFPLGRKSMHAMVVQFNGRHAILLGRDASYPAPVAFTLAHEMGHIAAKHIKGATAIVDVEDPALASDRDEEEREADEFALALLTGSSDPVITTQFDSYNAPTLADAVLKAGPRYRIEPGTLALCLAYRQKNWAVAMSSLSFVYSSPKPVSREVNEVARRSIDWESLGTDSADYLRGVLNIEDD